MRQRPVVQESIRPRPDRGRFVTFPVTYGTSVQGLPLEVWLPPDARPPLRMLIMAGIHGEEPETTSVLSRAKRSLSVPLNNCAVILAANPDGLVRGTRANANGIDLNRNFPSKNWHPDDVTHRWTLDETSDVLLSPGDSPGSEPETSALLDWLAEWKPACVVALHAPLACIDDPALSPLGQWLSEQTGMPLVEDVGYPTPGSFGSWASENGLPVITYEFERASMEHLSILHAPVLMALMTGACPGGEP
ncbi:MAG: murein tripeptide amidase MpaA [Verrucomicrobiae bacterium]|nr:murein tripeptide amidase MpaA [Verrucomicrobiae bacterium]